MAVLGEYIEYVALVVESAGVLIIAGGSIFFLAKYLFSGNLKKHYNQLRQDLGKVILLGLEVLVAGDIIATVTTKPTMESVLVLAVIVLIRTFLSFSLQIELEGKPPWKGSKNG